MMVKLLLAATGLLCGVAFLAGPAGAAELPAGATGIAAQYPGDAGIARDPDVILAEDFEGGSLDALRKSPSTKTLHGRRWSSLVGHKDSRGLKKTISIESGAENVHGGKHALKIVVSEDSLSSGGLFTRLKQGYDQLFARMYIKFAADYQLESHTGFMLTASADTAPWFIGRAGIVPQGNDRFGGTLEPEPIGNDDPPGSWVFYSYWHQMKGRWGNRLGNVANRVRVVRDRWICIELMFKANSAPDKRDGECAYWIDGKRVYHGKGLHWRTTNDLKLNMLYPHHYMNKNNRAWASSHNPRVQWFDDIVVATRYIGPTVERKSESQKKEKSHESSRVLLVGNVALRKTPPVKAPAENDPTRALFKDAEALFVMRQHEMARERFEKLIASHPESRYVSKSREYLHRMKR